MECFLPTYSYHLSKLPVLYTASIRSISYLLSRLNSEIKGYALILPDSRLQQYCQAKKHNCPSNVSFCRYLRWQDQKHNRQSINNTCPLRQACLFRNYHNQKPGNYSQPDCQCYISCFCSLTNKTGVMIFNQVSPILSYPSMKAINLLAYASVCS